MYYTEGGGINLYARPIEGLQAIIDLDERRDRQAARQRRRADPGGQPQLRRGQRRRAHRPAARAEADPHQPAARAPTSASTATSSSGRSGASTPASRRRVRAGDLAGQLRRPPGDVPGLAGRDLRALPGPERQLVLPDLHGRRRVRLRPARLAARAWGSTCPRTRCCSTAWSPRRFPTRRVPVVPLPLPRVMGVFERLDRQPGVAPLRAVLRRRLRRPRRGRAGGAQHRPGRQLRLPDRLDLHPERRRSASRSA